MALVSTKAMVYEGRDPHGQRFFKVIPAHSPHRPMWLQLAMRWKATGQFAKPGRRGVELKTDLQSALRKLDASPDHTFTLPVGQPGELNIYTLED